MGRVNLIRNGIIVLAILIASIFVMSINYDTGIELIDNPFTGEPDYIRSNNWTADSITADNFTGSFCNATNCYTVTEFLSDTNESSFVNSLKGNCTSGNVMFGVNEDGSRVCVTDQSGAGGDVNGTDINVLKANTSEICVGDNCISQWSEVNGSAVDTDSNASTACNDGEYLDGDGNCYNFNSTVIDNLGFFINYTPIKTTGNITNGTLDGYRAATAICNDYYSGTHMCQMSEIVGHISRNKSITGFDQTFRVSEGAPGYTADANDCRGWKKADGTALGSIWVGNTDNGGRGALVACNAERYIGCCK